MSDELTGVIVTGEQRQVHALEVTHPAWRIRLTGGQVRWWATRHGPPALDQLAAGMVSTVARESAEALAAALTVQDEIAQRIP